MFSLSPANIACYKIRMAAQSKIGFFGAGKMATALAKGFVNAEIVFPREITAADPFDAARKYFVDETGANMAESNVEVAEAATVLILATKPDQVAGVLAEISGVFTKNHLLISIAAGVPIAKLEGGLPAGARVIRVMYLEKSERIEPIHVRKTLGTMSIVLAVPTLVLGVYWAPLYDFVARSLTMVR